ncbi:hypothetical protein, partial [Acinetobacter baumannii]|uniref:hypothetical protein n=1 Tax=Acinetobacter baumannii TaxID=470 RepID=UPI0026EC6105
QNRKFAYKRAGVATDEVYAESFARGKISVWLRLVQNTGETSLNDPNKDNASNWSFLAALSASSKHG